MRRIDTLSQDELIGQLRGNIDAIRIYHPQQPSSTRRAAWSSLRKLIAENPTSIRRPRVIHNIGKQRAEWLAPLVEEVRDGIDYDSGEQ